MISQPEALRNRTKRFAIDIVHLFRSLPKNEEAHVLGKQLLRCGTSVAANYRAVCRARSKAEFVSKIGIVVEEADESVFWLELLEELSVVPAESIRGRLAEANELLAIFAASQHTAKQSSLRK
ncbi:MAG TPA: four helix bundle protein [Bacteroidota bacterium]